MFRSNWHSLSALFLPCPNHPLHHPSRVFWFHLLPAWCLLGRSATWVLCRQRKRLTPLGSTAFLPGQDLPLATGHFLNPGALTGNQRGVFWGEFHPFSCLLLQLQPQYVIFNRSTKKTVFVFFFFLLRPPHLFPSDFSFILYPIYFLRTPSLVTEHNNLI